MTLLHPQFRIRELLKLLLLLGILSVSLQAKESAQTNTLVFTNVTVIDGTGAAPLSNVTVVIRNGRITGIAKIGFIERNRYVHIVNGAGKYIIPGLWNMHMHLVQDVEPPYTKEILLPLLVANGITGVRDMGGNLDVLQSLRRDIQAGKLLGPRIVASGPMLDGPPAPYPDSMTIHNAEEGRAAVDMLKRKKSDFIEVQSLLSREAYFAIAEQARKRGITFVGQVPDDVTPAEASDAGQRSIEHFTNVLRACSPQEKELMQAAEEFSKRRDPSPVEAKDFGARQREQMVSTYDSARAAGLAAHFVSHSTWQVPTLVLLTYLRTSDELHWVTDARLKYVPVNLQRKWEQDRQAFLSGRSVENLAGWKIFFERNEELVRPFWLGGVRFLAGTDAGPYIFPGSSLHEELALLVQFGLSPMDTIQSATSAAAAFLGKSRELGTVEVGKDADLLLLDADPLADIHNTQKIAGVVLDGKYLSREELDRMLRQVEAAAHRQ